MQEGAVRLDDAFFLVYASSTSSRKCLRVKRSSSLRTRVETAGIEPASNNHSRCLLRAQFADNFSANARLANTLRASSVSQGVGAAHSQ